MADSAPKPAPVAPPPEKDKPKKSTNKKEKSDKPRGRPPELQKQLEDMFMGVALMTSAAIDPFDGEVIRDNAANLAESWHRVAQQNATIKRILNSMMETGAWSGAIAATAAVVVPIAQNHGAIPPNVPHPFAKPPRVQAQPLQASPPPQQHQAAMPSQAPPPVPGAVPQGPGQSPIQQSRSHTPPEPPPMPPGAHS